MGQTNAWLTRDGAGLLRRGVSALVRRRLRSGSNLPSDQGLGGVNFGKRHVDMLIQADELGQQSSQRLQVTLGFTLGLAELTDYQHRAGEYDVGHLGIWWECLEIHQGDQVNEQLNRHRPRVFGDLLVGLPDYALDNVWT